jgi:hypothetical protein
MNTERLALLYFYESHAGIAMNGEHLTHFSVKYSVAAT